VRAPDAEFPPARGTRLRFAHLSDLHLTTLAGLRALALRDQRLLGYLSWRRRRRYRHLRTTVDALATRILAAQPDHIVVTGDLTHIGHAEEIDEARAWLGRLGAARDVTLVPGNHDLYIARGGAHMLGRWRPWLIGDDATDAAPEFPSLRVRGPVAFIGLCSAAPSPPFFATGRLGGRQIDRLADLLAQTAVRGLCRVVLLHHAPLPGDDPWRKRLIDAPRLREVLRAHGAELVLHGHGHEATIRVLQSRGARIPIVQAPSASAATTRPTRRAAWNLCTVERRDSAFHLSIRALGLDDMDHRPAQAFTFPRP